MGKRFFNARCLSVVILVVIAGFPADAAALSEKGHSEMARLALQKHIRPSYAVLANAARQLEKSMSTYCAAPSLANRQNVNQNFEKTLLAWSRIDHIHFGPIARDDRISRFVFWPDPKNIGLRQIKKTIRTKNRDVLELAKLRHKSVALQGLGALEYLLYGPQGDRLGQGVSEAQFRCSYATTITRNLATIAANTAREWRDGEKFVEQFLHPHKDADHYMSAKEVTLALFLSFTTELKIIQHLKLGRPLGKSLKKARPRRAAFWRSKLEYKVIEANLAGIHALFDKVFKAQIAKASTGVEVAVSSAFAQMQRDLMSLKLPIGQAVVDVRQRQRLKHLSASIDKIKTKAGRAIIKAGDLSMGFNALDGD